MHSKGTSFFKFNKPFLEPSILSDRMLPWYDVNHRKLPWRANPGETANPYHVWLSEIMLQQTTVPTVIPYFLKFLDLWPTVQDLAQTPLDSVLHAWQGLGYYARARNLHACAQYIAHELYGRFPENEKDLRTLPGIGPYTAAAIRAIAFDRPAAPVDGNIERVLARIYALDHPLPQIKTVIGRLAEHHTPPMRAGDYVQALMDLGSSICTPKKPLCSKCPLQDTCKAATEDNPDRYPLRLPKALKPTRFMTALWIVDGTGKIILEKRPLRGLFGGLVTTPFIEEGESFPATPTFPDWLCREPILHQEILFPEVRHTFTHFHLRVQILKVTIQGMHPEPVAPLFLAPQHSLSQWAMPTLMKKVIKNTFELAYKTDDDEV